MEGGHRAAGQGSSMAIIIFVCFIVYPINICYFKEFIDYTLHPKYTTSLSLMFHTHMKYYKIGHYIHRNQI